MPHRVFISHSVGKRELTIVNNLARRLRQHSIECYVAERDWKFGRSIARKIEAEIAACDCLIAFVAVSGTTTSYVNQEIGIADDRGKTVIPIVEKGADIRGLPVEKAHVVVDHKSPVTCLAAIGGQLLKIQSARSFQALLGWALVAATLALADRRAAQ